MIRGIIFDVDGTLIDSNDAHAAAWKMTFDQFGFESSYVQIRSLIGMGGDKLLPRAVGVDKNSEIGNKLSKARSEIFARKFLTQLQPFPKAKELVHQLNELGIKLIVGSSAEESELQALLDIVGVGKILSSRVSSDDVKNSKPNPDIVRSALKKLSLSDNEVLFIGDTPYDIEAAARAGVKTIAFRCGGRTDTELKGALHLFDGPADLLKNLETILKPKAMARKVVRG